MSTHLGLVMFQSDLRDRAKEILEPFDYRPVTSFPVQSWAEVSKELQYPRPDKPRTRVHKAVAYLRGWTVLIDPEMVLAIDSPEGCAKVARDARAPAFGMVCAGSSGTYAISYFDPDLRRKLWVSEGEILENQGERLPVESGADDLNLDEDEVLAIMERLGVPFDELIQLHEYVVWELDESHIEVPPTAVPVPNSAPASKPWWKFW